MPVGMDIAPHVEPPGNVELPVSNRAETPSPVARPPQPEISPQIQKQTPPESEIGKRLDLEPATPEEPTYVIQRGEEFVTVTHAQMTPEERRALEAASRETPSSQSPEKSTSFLDDLKRRNPNYDYDGTGITPGMADQAARWANENGIDPYELGPSQIILAQTSPTSTKPQT